ncbi:hypothetical protein I3843_05G097000 [Carya illinoinensis]|uniref:DUF4408 domain-containing protein n=1 Tax=Carya illinoinensis TaxID=32201 RepID=A0A8T1QGZ5_CARIL|nr:translation initiation factor IF-2-like [Carya illinoinensis]KAG6653866.1 hypothetical protein CIPAW_05G106700 [Carya illinoinensis]KAG6712446.1 hypothetical protein I3842_05G104100 [Carya illinoinensis]KAG7978740.1 hypothetical protein I3843_05G097000 [Carya illinoinensis]
MDSIRAEKLRAMNSYKKNQFLYNLILHSLISLSCSLLFSYPYWFPSLCCTMKHFLSTSLPNLSAVFVNPKCLFVVVNVIVVFLVGESKLVASNSSPVGDLYDEYFERSQNLRRQKYSTFQEIRKVEKNSETQDAGYNIIDQDACLREEESNRPDEKEEKKLEMNLIEDSSASSTTRIEGKEVIKEKEKEVVKVEEEKEVNVKAEDDVEDEEEETGLPAEELNRRADEFIARVNRQMWIEAI